MQACFNASNALRASSDRDTRSDFWLASSPAKCLLSGWAIQAKPFMKHL